jgi:hypothetical protein
MSGVYWYIDSEIGKVRDACKTVPRLASEELAIEAAKRLVKREKLFASTFGNTRTLIDLLSQDPNCCSASPSVSNASQRTLWHVTFKTDQPYFTADIWMDECGKNIFDYGYQ